MNFICEKSVLQNAIATAVRAVPSKSPISTLEGILLTAKEGTLRITGYDLKKAIYTDIEADVKEEGKSVVNARFFGEMIRRLPEGPVSFDCSDENNITVKCGKSEYNFVGMDADEYPEMPKFNEVNNIEIPQNVLKSMINQTIFAVSKEEIRPIYTGSLFEIKENELTLVSIDGYRLARRVEKIEENAKLQECSFVVPGFSLSDIERICEDVEDNVIISVGDKHISFSIGSTVIISRRLEGEFINHRKSVPDNFRYYVEVERQELISVIDRVALVLSEKNGNPVKMKFFDDNIQCVCTTPIGKAEDICTCRGSAEELEIGFNDRYVIEALKAADKDNLMLCLNTSSSPCVIKAADGSESFTYMILPVRLHA